MTRLARLLYGLAAGLLFLHFGFAFLLANRVSAAAMLVALAAVALALPVGRRLPLVGRSVPRALSVLVLLCLANLWLAQGDREEIERRPLAFVGATILTGHPGAPPLEGGVVIVDGEGRITRVGDRSLAVPPGHEVVNIAGKYLLPGLINAHGHLLLSGGPPGEAGEMPAMFAMPWLADLFSGFLGTYPGERIASKLMERNAERALRGGVTTLRGLGDPGFLDVELRDRIAAGAFLGPRLLVAGPILAITGGHAHQIGQVFDGPDEARRAVRRNLSHQVDLIKIASTGGVSDSRRIGEAGELQMTPAELEAIVDEAHRKNILVTAHAESARGVLEALEAGVDNVEHGAELDARALALFRSNSKALRGHTTLHPTLSVVAAERLVTDAVRANPILYIMTMNGNDIRRRMLTGFRQAVAGDVKIAVGTDAGIVDHGSVWMEMKFFEEIGGISRTRAIHMATLGTAESIGVEDITGSIDAGKFADFVILDRNPLEDLSAFAEPHLVVAAGRLVPTE